MFNNHKTLAINLKGGIVAPAWLASVLEIANSIGIESVSFGARQQLLIKIYDRELEFFFRKKINEIGVVIEDNSETAPNILSSYAAADIFQKTGDNWLSQGVYQDVLALFEYQPQLKINICDAGQSFAPFFTGHLNFISSSTPHFWFCFIRTPKTNKIERFPQLIYTQDLAVFAKKMEVELINDSQSTLNPKSKIQNLKSPDIVYHSIDTELTIPRVVMPYYEGFNLLGTTPWIGIYRRNEQFSVKFLLEMCALCESTKIGNLCITTWRSLIIKGVDNADRFRWEKLLGKYGINVRHASIELNWQTEDDAPRGFRLKNYLVQQFNRFDVRTFGLIFAIKTRRKSEVFGSVIIRRHGFFKFGKFDFWGFLGVYDIFYDEDFNPHTRRRKTHRLNVPRHQLANELIILSKQYYAQLTAETVKTRIDMKTANNKMKVEEKELYQCGECFTVYEETDFDALSDNLTCTVCEAPKSGFLKIKLSALSVIKI